MKIGLDARLYRSSVAGIGRYSQNLIKNLLEIDTENQYILLMTPEDEKEFRNQNAQLIKRKTESGKLKTVITDIAHYSLAEQTKLVKILEEENCDLWHFLNFNFPTTFKGKFVATIHDLTLLFYPGRSKRSWIHRLGYRYIMRQACRKAAKVIAVSESTKNDITKVFKTDPAKIEVIYEAADDKSFANPSPELIESLKTKYKINEPVILYVGQWRPHKNLLGLINAFNQLRKEMPAKLAIIGKVDPAYLEIISTIDKGLALGDIIRPGFVDEKELAAWYKIADVFVFPSLYEGFGLPGLEAMMAGTPVASSNRTSLPEVYGDAAVYFDPVKPQEIADAIKRVLSDEKLRHDLIEKGKEKLKEYSWHKTAEETLKVYKSVINGDS